MPQGSRGYIAIKKETEWGKRVANNPDCFLPFVSESLTPTIEEVMSAIQRGIVDEPKSYQGEKAFAGDIVVEVHPISIGHILRSALGVPSTTAAETTETVFEDCEAKWTEKVDEGVILSLDASDKKKGVYSVKLQVTTGVGADTILATKKVSDAGIDMTAVTHIKFWIKSSVACTTIGDLVLMISETAECAGAEGTVLKSRNLPVLVADTWKECTLALGYMSRSDIAFVKGAGEDDDTITTDAGNFLTAGFVIGDKVLITGTDSNNDDVTVTLTGVAEKTLNMAFDSGIVDGDAGAAILNGMATYDAIKSLGIKMHKNLAEVTIHIDDVRRMEEGNPDVGTSKQHIFKPMQAKIDEFLDGAGNCPLYPYTIEVFRDEGLPFRYLGAVVNTLALNFSTTDKILKATCGIIAQDIADGEANGLSLETTNPFVWENAKIMISALNTVPATDVVTDLESFGVTFDNVCIAKYALNNTAKARKIIRNGVRTIPVNFTIAFEDRTEYANFILGTERSFTIKFEGALMTGETTVRYTLQIDLPLVRYLTYPINISGPGPIVIGVTGKAKYDAGGSRNYAIRFTLFNQKDTTEYQA